MAILVLLPGSFLLGKIARDRVTMAWWGSSHEAALALAQRVRAGRLGGTVETGVPSVELAQVVGPKGEMLSTSSAARNLPLLSTVRPPGDDPVQMTQACAHPRQGCLLSTAVRVWPEPDSPIVYTAQRVARPVVVGLLDILIVLQAVVLVVLSVWTVRKVVTRTLRPVREICTALERINRGGGDGRIEQPRGRGEVAQLAGCINKTLDQVKQVRKFASDVSHELRTPLTALRLHIEELQLSREHGDLDELLRQELRDVERLEEIISDLLLLSRLREGTGAMRPTPVDLGGLAEEEVTQRTGRIPVQLKIESDVWVLGMRTQIRRVLRNLLDNAQRHAISTIKVTVSRNGGSAELAVADDGHGVPLQDRDRIFERFTRLEESRKLDPGGTGLGLAISREIARAHGGSIGVEDSGGGGACFVLRLPLLGARENEEPPAPPVERTGQDERAKPDSAVHIRWIHLANGQAEQ
ncbi:sensor histidine kinase [Sphaerimonospora thailandensis]|uniref:sensor histidine kinase n=1 Tax=Sphaerimonospora thailandensis TaxID=795644 RepID=UPI00195121D5|nr:HAMP domain-containing sensor histidine kinase [Sphaerimonospora thailandensis]